MSTKKVTKIAVLTSGGDAPGMNAAIRAVVRTSLYHGLEVFGVARGYNGMIEDDIFPMNSRSVANIIQRGGTILKTARSKEFFETEGRQLAYNNLKKRGIDGIVVIGGDGSFKGAQKFSNEFDIPCIGIPGTIDKDIAVSVSGHYCFNSDEYRDIILSIDSDRFKSALEKKITELLDHYKTFDHAHPDVQFQLKLKQRLEELRKRDPFIYR